MTAEMGWYLYALLPPGIAPSGTGIDGRSPLRLIAEGGVAALASAVPLAQFGEEDLRRNLENAQWLEEKVRLHEAIVETALSGGPVLPMKFGTIFLEADSVRTVIRKNTERVRDAFTFLRGKTEWGVKGLVAQGTLRAAVLLTDPALAALSAEAGAEPPGRSYFLRRKLAEAALAKAQARVDALAQQARDAIDRHVVKVAEYSTLLPRSPEGDAVVLNVACLVAQENVDGLLAELERFNGTHAQESFRLVASGPWPPYHFVPQLDGDG